MRSHSRCLYLLGFCMNVCIECARERVFSYCRALNFILKKQNEKNNHENKRKLNSQMDKRMFISIIIVCAINEFHKNWNSTR